MRKLIAVPVILFYSFSLFAQTPQSWTSAEMFQAIKKLNVLGSVLYIAAHPDDENTRLIAYLSKDRLYRTGYLSLTRGDGGQNLIGDEQGIELGLIRTQELLAARRVDGGEQFFTRAFDFGYSKSPEETFTKWDREKILSDVVWVIRQFQPDVIINRFPVTGEGGHGHHTASGILANEAFAAAADPNRFPEQLKFVKPWQAKRILWNTFNFGGTNTTSADQFKLDVGGYNPLLGKSYGEIAATSRSNHKSQGFGSAATRGEAIEFFRTTGGVAPTSDIMDGVDLSWKRVAGGEAISKIIDSLSSSFDLMYPDKSVKGLVRLYQSLKALPAGYWRDKKLQETQQLIEQCSGLFMDATTSEQFGVKTDSIRINFAFNNRLGTSTTLKMVTVAGPYNIDSSFNLLLNKNRNFNYSKTFYIPGSAVESQPYWLENKMEEGYYNVPDATSNASSIQIGQADADPTFFMIAKLNIEGTDIEYTRPVKYKFTDPVKGELYEPLVIVPPFNATPEQSLVLTRDNNNFEGTLNVVSRKKNALAPFNNNSVAVKTTDGTLTIKYEPGEINFTAANLAIPVRYKVKASIDNDYDFSVASLTTMYDPANPSSKLNRYRDFHQVKYNHIPYISYFTDPVVKNTKLDLKTYGKKIGYIVGAGDKVPEALEQMGYEVTLLTDKELSKNGIDKYDAIITGVRAHNTNEWMTKHYDKLMKYVNEGGNFIVQYDRPFNGTPPPIGPYKFDVVNKRITDENADVVFLKPDHPVMNFPNKITPDDFKGWIQERSIYHASNFDKTNFETIFSMHDPGEASDDGSLIIAKYGKGYFTYTGLVFFRELPAGVPGAYRLLANIIALNRKKGF